MASAFGGIDILVNNAAEQPAQHGPSYTDADDEWFQRQINVKVIGYLRTIRAVVPLMIENKRAGSSTSADLARARRSP